MRDQDVFLQQALLATGTVDAEQMERARRYAAEHDLPIDAALVHSDIVSSRDLALTRADICEAPFVDLGDYEPCYANTQFLPRSVAERFTAFPLFLVDGVMTLAMVDPLNLEALDQVRQVARCEVETVLAEQDKLETLISRAYSLSYTDGEPADLVRSESLAELDTTEPIVAAVNQIMADAVDQRASDVHINPDERELHIRFRIDGVLNSRQGPPISMHPGLVQRLKVMANLDLTQTRRPQDGKFRFRHHDLAVDVRMSTLPTIHGENVVLRLLAAAQSIHDFHELGISATMANDVAELAAQPYGIILVTGPTGSGKTTTLYTLLNRLNEPSRNIMTVEDPVEIRLPYVRQIQVNPEIGLSFANALRSILRQDPDVVLVGEVRDNETATIALQAALTGHLVLSTLHTNDAVGSIARLRDYGLPPFVINSSVLGVLAQRLVRRVCGHCVAPEEPSSMFQRRFGLGDDIGGFVAGRGCARCGQSGYSGRVGVYELLRISPGVQELIEAGGSVERIRERALREGMRLMWQDGIEKARLGLTTLEELAKAVTVVMLEEPRESRRLVA